MLWPELDIDYQSGPAEAHDSESGVIGLSQVVDGSSGWLVRKYCLAI